MVGFNTMYIFHYWCTNGTHNKSKSVSNIAELIPLITQIFLKVLLLEYPMHRLVIKYNDKDILRFDIKRSDNNE